jgi:hypothetical protein
MCSRRPQQYQLRRRKRRTSRTRTRFVGAVIISEDAWCLTESHLITCGPR